MNRRMTHRTFTSKLISLPVALMLLTANVDMSAGARNHPKPISVGMVALLATPEKYNGKVIRTWGFLNLRYEGDALFLHEEDCRVPLLKNSFRLELTEEQEKKFKDLNLTYVMVEGTLHSEGAEGTDLNSGVIVHITLVQGWKPFVPFEPKTR